ncbi:hypothetical protein [Streptomyces sp. NPDC053048]|uniref:hypothetical protein n=1 Tax=Streptomyces sp. NPDC053048 TaxID=3365694 RepID=UPI0037D01D48
MGVHHHAYMWLGSGADYGNDSIRRRSNEQFSSTSVAPIEPANWLLKNPRFIKGTYSESEIDKALAWFESVVKAHAESIPDHAREEDTIRNQLEGVRQSMKDGRDAVGGWWYKDGRTFLSVSLVACPNWWRPEYKCPAGSR